jgi:hypothetical protein
MRMVSRHWVRVNLTNRPALTISRLVETLALRHDSVHPPMRDRAEPPSRTSLTTRGVHQQPFRSAIDENNLFPTFRASNKYQEPPYRT